MTFSNFLAKADKDALFRRAQDPTTWARLFASLSRDVPEDVEAATTDNGASEHARTKVVGDGYFVTPPLLPAEAIADATLAIEAVEAAGWPPVFAFMSDALWDLVATPAFRTLLETVMGEEAAQLPGLWAKRVSGDGDAGWSPHVDVPGAPQLREDGRPARLSIWIALTDARVDNGCMFVVPEDVAPDLSRSFETQADISVDSAIRLLHHATPLPAAAGAVLGWRTTTLHWGGQFHPGAPDRLSVALEFGHPEIAFTEKERPAFALGLRPDFLSRLALIGRSLVMYGAAADREPQAAHFVQLGRRLMSLARN